MSNNILLTITETAGNNTSHSYKYKFYNKNFNLVLCNALLPKNILQGEDGMWCGNDGHCTIICLDATITFSSYKKHDSHIKIITIYEEIKEAFEEIHSYQANLLK